MSFITIGITCLFKLPLTGSLYITIVLDVGVFGTKGKFISKAPGYTVSPDACYIFTTVPRRFGLASELKLSNL